MFKSLILAITIAFSPAFASAQSDTELTLTAVNGEIKLYYKKMAVGSLERLRSGIFLIRGMSFDDELFDFDNFREAGRFTLEQLGTTKSEIQRLQRTHYCSVAVNIHKSIPLGIVKHSQLLQIRAIVEEYGPCPLKK